MKLEMKLELRQELQQVKFSVREHIRNCSTNYVRHGFHELSEEDIDIIEIHMEGVEDELMQSEGYACMHIEDFYEFEVDYKE